MQRITITPNQIQDRQIALTVEQNHYLTRVIRLHSGSQFQAIGGNAQILQISSAIDRELPQPITLICALPKGNNFDDLVRACTEIGVTTILPAISDRTLLNPSPQKLQRWRKIAQEATEQSERIVCPIIAEPQPLQAILSQMTDCNGKYLCHSRGEHPHLLTCLQSRKLSDSPIIVAIGPEGGWTDAEIDMAIEYKFQLISLGRHILRTITAPIVALSIVTAAIEHSEG